MHSSSCCYKRFYYVCCVMVVHFLLLRDGLDSYLFSNTINNTQGKARNALDDYVFATLLQQRNQEAPTHQPRIDAIVKEMALKSAASLFQTYRNAVSSTVRPLPSRSHCRNFLESYPSMHMWAQHYKGVQREDLVEALSRVEADAITGASTATAESADIDAKVVTEDGEQPVEEEISSATSALEVEADRSVQLLRKQRTLDLICFDLVNNNYSKAFSLLATLPLPLLPSSITDETTTTTTTRSANEVHYVAPFESAADHLPPVTMDILNSLHYELLGFEKHLRCDLGGAIEAYNNSLVYLPSNIDTRLKLTNVHLEQGDLTICKDMYASLLELLDATSQAAALSGDDKLADLVAIMKSWTLLHRVSVAVAR